MKKIKPQTLKLLFTISVLFFNSCSTNDSIPSVTYGPSTIEYDINGLIQTFDRESEWSVVYDRNSFCNNDAYVYLISSTDGSVHINMVGSVPQETINVRIENKNNVKSINDLEIEDSCKIGSYQDGSFININQTKYYYKSGIFETQLQKIVPSEFSERAQHDILTFKDTIFMNDQNEEIVINAEYKIVTSFIK